MAAASAAANLPVAEVARGADARPSALRSEKSGDVTPETVTPPTRSVSPSSDGGALLSPRDAGLGAALGAASAFQKATDAEPASRQVDAGGGRQEAPAGGQQTSGSTLAPQESTAASSGRGGNKKQSKAKGNRGGVAHAQAAFALASGFGPLFGGGNTSDTHSTSDRRIIKTLTAPEEIHRRLLWTARQVPAALEDPEDQPLVSRMQLYGSLSLDMTQPEVAQPWKQDWASYYVNARSDVDFVVEMRPRVTAAAIAQRLTQKGNWRLISKVEVHKFASTQLTLLGSFPEDKDKPAGEDCSESSGSNSEVYLDVTCIENEVHFDRFKARQEAFRTAFSEVRRLFEAKFGIDGALAFDVYVHLLKAFAAKVPGNTLTGFQATCIGLFVLQIGFFRLKVSQSIALSLFEGFLRFCKTFYGDPLNSAGWPMPGPSYRQCAIDLSQGGRFMPRLSENWRSELYFLSTEGEMDVRGDERVNVTHSLDPRVVAEQAQSLLNRAFAGHQFDVWL